MQLSPAEFEAVRRTQTLDFADERLVNRSGHARTVIEVSRTEDDLSSQAGVNADEVADERALGTAPTSTLPSTASKSKVAVSIEAEIGDGRPHPEGWIRRFVRDGDGAQPGHRFLAPGRSTRTRTDTEERQFEFGRTSAEPGVTRGHSTRTVRDREAPVQIRAPDQKTYSNRGLRLLRLAHGGHREVTDFLGTGWRQPGPSGFRTVN